MRLEAVTAELRPRSEWEAVDLGLALVRRDFWGLLGAWWMAMLPALVVAGFLHDRPFLLLLLFWWWIPAGSRMALIRLSRRLFGDRLTAADLWREWPRAMVRRFPFRMLLARLSPWRPLTMPVEELEGLRGEAYRNRVRILLRRGDSTVVVLAVWRAMLAFWLALAVFGTALLFVTGAMAEEWMATLEFWREGEFVEGPASLHLVLVSSFLLSMCLVDLFSVGAGFGVYLNHRTWIEGWDVELAFRRMANRIRVLPVVVAAAVAGFATGVPAEAQESVGRGEAKSRIEAILQHEDFTVHEETYRVPNSSPGSDWNFDWAGEWVGLLGIIIVSLLVAAGLGLVGWLIWRNRHVFRDRGGGRVGAAGPKATVVMGMDVRPESLPDDIVSRALELWRRGAHHEAMSLLYRGAISWMIQHGGVEIAESDTESDCLGRVRGAGAGHLDYFSGLTGEWMRVAYAREIPLDERFEGLCRGWPFRKGGGG